MALVFEILLGVMILASFFVAYMSARTWHVGQVVLVAFLFLGTVGYFYLAARTLATHNAWGKAVAKREAELNGPGGLKEQIKQVIEGGVDKGDGKTSKSMRKLRQELHALVVDRGGIIAPVTVDSVKDGVVGVTLKAPGHGLMANHVVFAFDDAPLAEGGRFRGEFKVSQVDEKTAAVQLTPNIPLTPQQAERLNGAKGPWTLYINMPIDDAEVFAALDEATRAATVPQQSAAEYAKADRVLRDYAFFFQQNFIQRELLADSIAKITSNLNRTTAATKSAEDEIAFRGTEKKDLEADLQQFKKEQQVIAAYQKSLEAAYRRVREELKATYARNRQMAAQLTAEQTGAAGDLRSGARASLP